MAFARLCCVLVCAAVVFSSCKGDQIRIAGTAENYGRLEVLHDDAWGTVCDDGFDDTDAIVACQTLGYQKGFAIKISCMPKLAVCSVIMGQPVLRDAWLLDFKNPPSSTIWLDEVACAGNESDFLDCPHNGWGKHDCETFENVGLFCYVFPPTMVRLVDGTYYEGRVEIMVGNTWGTMCGEGFTDHSAAVVCRMLGFTGGVALLNKYVNGTGFIWMKDVDCVGNESDIFSCSNSGISCQACKHSQDVGVQCSPQEERAFSPVGPSVACHPNNSVDVFGLEPGNSYFAMQTVNEMDIRCHVTELSTTSVRIDGCYKDEGIIFSFGSFSKMVLYGLIGGQSITTYHITCTEISADGEIRHVANILDVGIIADTYQLEPTYDVTSSVEPASAVVGTPVVWTINFPADYSLQITNCSAYPGTNDQAGFSIPLISLGGCSLTTELISDFTDTGNGSAMAVIQAFKFVTSNSVFLTCNLLICPDNLGACDRSCSLPSVRKRDVSKQSMNYNTSLTRTVGRILYVKEFSYLEENSASTVRRDALIAMLTVLPYVISTLLRSVAF